MSIRMHERYVVDAPITDVWRFLVDPYCVVGCVPGGELIAVLDDRNFRGRVRVIVGPLTLSYGGRIRLADVDELEHRVRIVGFARETAGDDSARLTLDSWLVPTAPDRTEVLVEARVDVAGKIIELGGGFLGQLAHLVFQDFARCVRADVEAGVRAGATRVSGCERAGSPHRAALRALPLVWRALRAWVAGTLATRRARPG